MELIKIKTHACKTHFIKKDDYDNANEFQAIECYTQKGKQKFEPFNGNSYAGALYTNKRHFNLATSPQPT